MHHVTTIHPQSTLAELASTRPGASRVFARHDLDFCCRGQTSLERACAERGLHVDTVLGEITAAESAEPAFDRWDRRPLPELIDHLVADYHLPHREELPRLIAMAERVERLHRDKLRCPLGLAALLRRMHAELGQHMQKEVQTLFPAVLREEYASAAGVLGELEREHADTGDLLAAIRQLSGDYTAPLGACRSWQTLCRRLAEFEHGLRHQLHLENHIVFPRVLQG